MRALPASLCLALVGAPAACIGAQDTGDEAAVRTVVDRYLHGLKFNDVASLKEAFWPDAKLYFVGRDGHLGQLTQADWYKGFVASAGKEEQGTLRITTLEVTRDVASVKVVEDYPASRYTDYLSLVKFDGRWWIVNKIYTSERTTGGGAAATPALPAFVPKSQHGSVSQRIAGARVTIEYNRPVARGRELFGKLVPYDAVWQPGADTATTIALSTAIRINGQMLAAGTYSLWAVPGPDKWTIIFNRVQPVWHRNYPEGQDALRVTAMTRTGPHVESLMYSFPMVDSTKAELDLRWGTVIVPLQLEVP
jgi:hypothetical protein